jgi:hypothetical protein
MQFQNAERFSEIDQFLTVHLQRVNCGSSWCRQPDDQLLAARIEEPD